MHGLLHWNIHTEYQLYYSVFPVWTSVNLIFFTLASKKSGVVVQYEEQRNTSTTSVEVWAWHTPMVLRELHTGNDYRQRRTARLTLIGFSLLETSLFR